MANVLLANVRELLILDHAAAEPATRLTAPAGAKGSLANELPRACSLASESRIRRCTTWV